MAKETEEKDQNKSDENFVAHWLGELEAARKREKDFRKEGVRVQQIYEAEEGVDTPFNILYSNTETLAPALYNSTPRPVVQRRFKDEDPQGKSAAMLTQRLLEFLLDSDNRDCTSFDGLLENAVLNALVPGRGVIRFKYDATLVTEGDVPRVSREDVLGESVPWNRFLHGHARFWKDVPWVAFEWPMTKEELERNFGVDLAARCELADIGHDTEDGKENIKGSAHNTVKGAWVTEIWDRESREVFFISPAYKDGVLKRAPDPLELAGFFPTPEPLTLFRRIDSLLPVPLYKFYETQAKELNVITGRIDKIVKALKIRGGYDTTIDGLEKIIVAEDNTLVPVDNLASLDGKKLEDALYLVPIDKLVAVLQQLYTQRQQVKQVIYEITGIADIMRGTTTASETLGAQQLKNQWGTLRLKKSQKAVSRYARDCLRLMAEIAVTKLSPETIRGMTGVKFPSEAELEQARQLQQTAMVQQIQPSPEIAQVLGQPSLESLLELLKDDLQRSYRIDIETNSTVDLEATEDKQDTAELMNSIAQFLNGVAPSVEKGIMPFDAAKAMLLGIVRKFRFGGDVEDLLKQMQPPPPSQQEAPKGPTPEEQAVVQAENQLKVQRLQQETELAAREHQFKVAEHEFKMMELQRKAQLAVTIHNSKMMAHATKASEKA